MTDVKGRPPAVEPHLPMLMGMVFGHLRDRLSEEAPELRPSQLRVLEWLPPEGLTISELAESVEMTTQGCGQFVRQLAELGMVEVAVADHDARARQVTITDVGREALARANAAAWAGSSASQASKAGRASSPETPCSRASQAAATASR